MREIPYIFSGRMAWVREEERGQASLKVGPVAMRRVNDMRWGFGGIGTGKVSTIFKRVSQYMVGRQPTKREGLGSYSIAGSVIWPMAV
jgi:hypothetical protein